MEFRMHRSSSISNLARRYACDRCRRHKLRCNRESSSESVCRRCDKAGVVCETTPDAPIGARKGMPRSAAIHSTRVDSESSLLSTEHNATECLFSGNGGDATVPSLWHDPSSLIPGQDGLADFNHAASLNLTSELQVQEEDADGADPTGRSISSQTTEHVCNATDMIHAVPSDSHMGRLDSHIRSKEPEKQTPSGKRLSSYVEEFSTLNIILSNNLQGLLDCCEGLEQVYASSPEDTTLVVHRVFDASMNTCGGMPEMLKVGEKFINLVQAMNTLKWRTAGSDTTFTTTPEDRRPLSTESSPNSTPSHTVFNGATKMETSLLLSILASYSTLIELIQTMLSALLFGLRILPTSALDEPIPPKISRLELCGITLSSRRLQVRLFMDVLKYQIDLIEQRMGFNTNGGVASNSMFMELFSTLMQQKGFGKKDSGMEPLRDLIQKVDAFLGT